MTVDSKVLIKSIVDRCGGVASLATRLDVSPGTIYGWIYKYKHIPREYWEEIYQASAMTVSLEELANWGIYSSNN